MKLKILSLILPIAFLHFSSCSPTSSNSVNNSDQNPAPTFIPPTSGGDGAVATKVFIFQSENALSAGEVGSRTRATNMCRGSYLILNSAVSCNRFSAFMLFSEDISAENLSIKESYPTSAPIFLLDNTTHVASSFSELIGGTPNLKLGQFGMKSQYFWNGMRAGNLVGDNCSNWTSSAGGTLGSAVFGKVGNLENDSSLNSWTTISIGCSNQTQVRIMCMCW